MIEKTCKIKGCETKVVNRGLCARHCLQERGSLMKNDKDKCVNAKCEKKPVEGGLCEEHNEALKEVATEDLHNESEELECSKCGKDASECQFNRKKGKCYSCVAKDRYTDKKAGKSKPKDKPSGSSLPDAAAVKDQASEKNPRSGNGRGTNRDVVDAVSSSATASSIGEGIKEGGIGGVCNEIKHMLFEKNRLYGNSAFNPIRVFSKAGKLEQLNVRIDDKISRLMSGQLDDKEDVIKDLIGYLILLLVAQREG